MAHVEYRVRPVIRYNLTRFESGSMPCGGTYGGCETVGEYQNEDLAERVKAALEASDPVMPEANGYMLVKSGFEVETEVYYAQTLTEAQAMQSEREASGGEWRIARRV